VLRLRGWAVEQVMNLTDVDDKIIARAGQQGRTITEVTDPVIEIFHADREFLRIEAAEHYPRATEFIPEMIALVERLVALGVAYQADDRSVYFAIGRFPAYGRLSRLDTRTLKTGARVSQDEYSKENAQDFALWKAAVPEDEAAGAAWDSPWGRGRPGWHLECSAMAMAILGETLDLHCGGVDLVFPHHEDEIAQSEAATGRPFSRLWCHGEHLLIDNEKMAKRLGNVWTVKDMREKRISPAALRHFVFSTHYRKQLSLSDAALEQSVAAVRRVGDFAERIAAAPGASAGAAAAAEEFEIAARAALFNDLNAPQAMGALFVFISRVNAELDAGGAEPGAIERVRAAFAVIDGVLDIVPAVEVEAGLASWVAERLAARAAARAARDFGTADAIRGELAARGVAIEDSGGGTRWKVVR
jgi:cysteinyl-tRNA synthetase